MRPRFWSDTLFARIFLLVGALLLASQLAVYWYFNVYQAERRAQFPAQNWAQILTLSESLGPAARAELAPTLARQGMDWRPASAMSGSRKLPAPLQSALQILHGLGWPEAEIRLDRRHDILWLRASPTSAHAIAMPLPRPAGPSPQWFKLSAILLLSLLGTFLIVRQLTRPLSRIIAGVADARTTETLPELPVAGPADVQRLAEKLNQALRDVHQLWKEREMVLLGVSHDLRTPLTRMRMLLEFLPPNTEVREELIANLREMDEILRQFLDYARSGQEEPSQVLDLPHWLEDFVERQGPDIQLDLPDERPLQARLRPVGLARILQNLIDNARRHAAPPFLLHLRREGTELVFVLRDHGSGIPAGDLENLERPFAVAGRGGGTGLGLAIVRRLVQAQRGALHFRDAVGGGLEVEVRLPER
ncbi:MAG: ATP-binding protein [Acidithiobacillus sp.]|uniref:ATP-binding protein n=1 Tax=Acidithiobacillus sp. TaxID=1872118 RepID=UPI003D02B87B